MGLDELQHVACRQGEPAWENWARNQQVHARCTLRPKNLKELIEITREVSAAGMRMRPVATGLSFSDILQTNDTLVVLTDLKDDAPEGTLLPLESELWSEPTPNEPRVRIVCGARIRELNAALDRAGLAFANLGGFDGQTFIGALSTSTHGSGIGLGPLCDSVLSIDLVSAFGKRFRIEPSTGITDPTRFAKRYGSEMTLVQNDDWFYSVVVSLGCMGVVHSVVCKVMRAYDLVEHRSLDTWSNVRAAIASGSVVPSVRHYEISLNPYPRRDGEYTCLVTRRSFARPGQERVPLTEIREELEDLAFLPSTQAGVVSVMRKQPRLIPLLLETGFGALVTGRDGHIDKSYVIYNIGKINYADVLSGEYFMPLVGDAFVRGIDRLLAVVRDNAKRGLFQTAPLSMRFIHGSNAYLSMMHGAGPFGSVEVPMFTHVEGAAEAVLSYEQALYEFRSRPHWGQLHELTGTRGWAARAYPKLDRWREVRSVLDCQGTFDNHFTDRLSLSAGC